MKRCNHHEFISLAKGFSNDVVPRSASKLLQFLQQSVSANQHLVASHPEPLEALGLEAMDRDLPDPLIALQAGERPTEEIGRQLMDLQIGDDALVELAPHLERQIRLAWSVNDSACGIPLRMSSMS